MARPLSLPPPGFDDLPVEDKLDYVQALWDRIFAQPDEVPVPDWHRRVLQDRVAEHQANPDAAIPWETSRSEILAKLKAPSRRRR